MATGDDLIPTDIIPLVVYAWHCSFAIVASNKKAICERGWFPLNRILLLEPVLRETMTIKDIEQEKEEGLNPMYDEVFQQYEQAEIINNRKQGPNMRINTTSNVACHGTLEDIKTHDINFGNGLTQYYIKNIIRKTERERVLEKIQEEKVKDETFQEQLGKVNRVSAGSLVKCGSYVIGKDVEEVMKMRVEVKRKERKDKQDKEDKLNRKYRNDADTVIAKNTGKVLSDWTVTDLKILLKPEKLKEDGAMPQSKKDLITLYKKCVSRNTRMSLIDSPAVGNHLLGVGTGVAAGIDTDNTVRLDDNDGVGHVEM
jgi:hypothetical protein